MIDKLKIGDIILFGDYTLRDLGKGIIIERSTYDEIYVVEFNKPSKYLHGGRSLGLGLTKGHPDRCIWISDYKDFDIVLVIRKGVKHD